MTTAVALVATGCALGDDQEAIAACETFQDHLDQMRGGAEQRDGAIALAEQAAAEIEAADDEDLAMAITDYERVIVRFALAADDVREAEQQRAVDGSPAVQERLADAERRLTEAIQAGDLVLSRVSTLCLDHDVELG